MEEELPLDDLIDYVAEMSMQLADLCRNRLRGATAAFELAAELALDVRVRRQL